MNASNHTQTKSKNLSTSKPGQRSGRTSFKGEDGDQDDKDDNVDNVQTRTSPPAASSSTGRQSEDGGAAAGGLDPAVELNRYAERIVRAHVTLLVEKASETQCVEAFKSCSAVQNVSGDDHKKRVGIHYHVWLSAESITAPHKRKPPFRQEHLRKLIHSAMKARIREPISAEFIPNNFGEGDIGLIIDGKPAGAQ